MKILLATDHAGFNLKNDIKDFLTTEGFEVEDMGAHVLDPEDHYPEIMVPLAMRLLQSETGTRAIVFGKSGQGEAMLMNRFPGVRTAVYYGKNIDIIRLSREHNDANVLSLAAGFLTPEEAREAVKLWISTPFSGDARHVKRNTMLDTIE